MLAYDCKTMVFRIYSEKCSPSLEMVPSFDTTLAYLVVRVMHTKNINIYLTTGTDIHLYRLLVFAVLASLLRQEKLLQRNYT